MSEVSKVMSVRLTETGSETRPAVNRVWKNGPCVYTKPIGGVYYTRKYYLSKRRPMSEEVYIDLTGAIG